ncbi:MAG: tRNA (adenosine(37)-N6)-threonylcarbamoyltransferase complex ATPase subunit type 1 TsaE [Magnetospirillum sp. WYHS-4]
MTAPLAAIDLPDEEATRRLGRRLAGVCRPGDVFALAGDLGCGKTVLARAFIAACEGHDEEVPSPTFTLVQTYETGRGSLYHFDLYRLERPDDAYELDIEEAFAEAISLIEWPERLGHLLPPSALTVGLAHAGGDARRAVLSGPPAWAPRIEEAGLVR